MSPARWTTRLLGDERRPFVAEPPAPDPRPSVARRLGWIAGALLIAAAVVVTCLLAVDEMHTNQNFDQAHASLHTVQRERATAAGELKVARNDLSFVTSQVGSDTTALTQYTAELKGAQAALSAAQAHVAAQASLIKALHTCLGGVERSLNALAVGRKPRAAAALEAVAPNCSQATAASG